ncbi:PhoU domain-containing protein [Paucidesulfovibrio longus]|uniref:PhoU domain-containing protein n=1 Tax=Paucidesulfovibrio longus TaxID=889 RepID=UPI0003B45A2D|nr:PhoU domain-containing protein [Paucidesulfovibrio longus]
MIAFEGLDENFRFIVLEVEKQVRATADFVSAPGRQLYNRIVSRDDYVDNLKTIIENKCYSRIHSDKQLDSRQVNKIRSMQVMCVNLERIADYCVNIVRQVGYLQDTRQLDEYPSEELYALISASLAGILDAFRKEDMSAALAICKAEYELDRMYKENFDRLLVDLGSGRNVQSLVTVLFIFRYLERIGDSLLNIGEALIFSILGERIKIEQFDSLQQTLSKSGFSESFSDIDFQSIWGTRSGCRIGRVERREHGGDTDGMDVHGGIYKEGGLEKIRKERDNIERWKAIFPGLVADVYGYHEDGSRASLLVEFLPGCTLDEVVLGSDEDFLSNAVFVFEQTVRNVWETTMRREPVKVDFIRQLNSRLEDVLQVHPEFRRESRRLGDSRISGSNELLSRCAELEAELEAPFTVFIHGDFNVNNVVYDHAGQQIHFIDLYRSRDYDYVQDVSVFLVSNFRMPIFQDAMRARLNGIIGEFHRFAKEFSQSQGDETFEARMAFALARSFYTSTRFELNHRFAREMFNRALFLLERISNFAGNDWRSFKFPAQVLYY